MNLEEYRNALRSQLNDLNDEGSELNIWLAGVLKDKDDIARREIFMENMSQLLIKQQTLSQVLDDLKKENGPDWLASEVLNHSGL